MSTRDVAGWLDEVEVALARLHTICAARGWDFSETVQGLKQGDQA